MAFGDRRDSQKKIYLPCQNLPAEVQNPPHTQREHHPRVLEKCWKAGEDSISLEPNNAAAANKAGRYFQAQTRFPESMKKSSAASRAGGRGSAGGVTGQDRLFEAVMPARETSCSSSLACSRLWSQEAAGPPRQLVPWVPVVCFASDDAGTPQPGSLPPVASFSRCFAAPGTLPGTRHLGTSLALGIPS